MDSMMEKSTYENSGKYDQTVPEYMHMLRHLKRSQKHTNGFLPKSIFKTQQFIKSVGAHTQTSCMNGYRCPKHFVKENFAHLAHYREGCQKKEAKNCISYTSKVVDDLGILRFKDDLIQKVNSTLHDLQLL